MSIITQLRLYLYNNAGILIQYIGKKNEGNKIQISRFHQTINRYQIDRLDSLIEFISSNIPKYDHL